jgi:hypothetical protein
MPPFILGLITGIIGTLAVSAFFAFGPEKLRDGGLNVLGLIISNVIPFGIMRQLQLRISESPVQIDGEARKNIRMDDRHEMIFHDRKIRYSFSLWHLVPTGIVIPLARFARHKAKLEYGQKTTYTGSLLKIDRNVSIFTLDGDSFAARLEQWGRSPKPPMTATP